MRLLEKSTGARGTLGSGLLRVDRLGCRDRRWTHVGASFPQRRLGLGRSGVRESDLGVGCRLDWRFDSNFGGRRRLDRDRLCRVLKSQSTPPLKE
jgi:hypothetical protein